MGTVAKEVQVIKATKTGEKSEKIRVAAYCRVSTDKDDQLNSFFAQMRYYRDYVRGNDKMELVDIYADEGITGTELEKRDEMKRLIRDCKHKKIDRVLVKSVTRFARNSLECIETIRTMQSCGVSVLFENDRIDTEKMNSEMMLFIKSAFAQSEATSASKRMSTSIRMKMEDGTYYNIARPYGYRWEDRNLVIVPEEAEIVREIYSMYLSGETNNAIAKKLKENVPERKWGYNSIRYILTNERYVGDILWQKTYTPDVLPLKQKKNRGELAKYVCYDTHQGIIERETFESVQRLMKQRKSANDSCSQREKSVYYKKVKCGNCGWAYKAHKIKNDTEWTCGKSGRTAESCCTKSISEKKLNAAFVRIFNRLKTNKKVLIDETILQLQNLKAKTNRNNESILEIDETIANLSRQNSLYSQMYANNVIDETTYMEKTDTIKGEISEARSRRTKMINGDEEESFLEELRKLSREIEKDDFLAEFSREMFRKYIKMIIVEKDGALSFMFTGDLKLTVDCER